MNAPQIPDLKIGEYCGSGAYGDVWIAEDLSGLKRAVKVLNKARLTSMGVLQKEQKALALFRQHAPAHPNLIEIYHVGETDSDIYYIMELGDNAEREAYAPDTLEHRLKVETIFSAEECVSLTVAILEAVKVLHDADLVHRDIKPSNIIYCGGVAKLADIGLVASNSSNLSFGGTRYFIPPDQSMGQEADLYAVGKMLYCVFTGLPPQEFPTLPDRIVEEMTPRRKLINKVIGKACAKKSDARFASTSAFINALKGNDESLNQKVSFKTIVLGVCLAVAIAIAIVCGLLRQGDNNHKSPSSPVPPARGSHPTASGKAPPLFKTSKERKAFAKLLLKYQLHYAREEFDKALKCLDMIKERWPAYPDDKLNRFRSFIEKKRKVLNKKPIPRV